MLRADRAGMWECCFKLVQQLLRQPSMVPGALQQTGPRCFHVHQRTNQMLPLVAFRAMLLQLLERPQAMRMSKPAFLTSPLCCTNPWAHTQVGLKAAYTMAQEPTTSHCLLPRIRQWPFTGLSASSTRSADNFAAPPPEQLTRPAYEACPGTL